VWFVSVAVRDNLSFITISTNNKTSSLPFIVISLPPFEERKERESESVTHICCEDERFLLSQETEILKDRKDLYVH